MKIIDITDKVFGKLTVIRRHAVDSTGKVTWVCRCSCGNEVVVVGANIKNGNTTSCGCAKKSTRKREDLTGRIFGRLTVVSFAGTDKIRGYWNCKCLCGKSTVVQAIRLKKGETASCGCLQFERGFIYDPNRPVKCRNKWGKLITGGTCCFKCGREQNLEAHHFLPVSRNEALSRDLTNGIALCVACHDEYHSKYKINDINLESFIKWSGVNKYVADFLRCYVVYKSKGGIEDLKKAIHSIELLIEFEEKGMK